MPLPVACLAVSAAAAGCAAASPPPGHAMTAKVIDRTQVRIAPDGRSVGAVGRFTEYGGRRVYRVVARRGDWLGVLTPQRPNGRTGWIRASRAVLSTSRYKITVDRSARRLTLRRAGKVVKRITVTVGKASTPTPLGRFAVTDKLWMEPGSVYGCCALALSGSQTVGGLAGIRLAIHGTRYAEPMGRFASAGCTRATKHDLRWLMRRVPVGTPVTVVR